MNLGIERQIARGAGDVLVLTHDARLRPGAVAVLMDAARRAPEYGVLGPALVLAGTEEPFSFGAMTRSNGSVTHVRERPAKTGDGIAGCDWIDGGTMLLRGSMLRRIGGFDERYFMYAEDADLCLRAARAGYRVGVVVDAVAEQAPGGAKRRASWAYLITRNGLEYARSARGRHGVLFVAARSSLQAGFGLLRAGARAGHLRAGDAGEPWAESIGTLVGMVDFVRRRWGPPPALPGPGDVMNTRPPHDGATHLPRVLHMGPGLEIGGGMAAALRSLLDSPLADRYVLDVVATYRGPAPLERLAIFGAALARLLAWRLRRRGRIVHVHAAVRGSMYRKSVFVLVAKALRSRVVLQVHAGPGDVEAFAARINRPSRELFRAAFRATDVSLAVSRASASALERALDVGPVGVVPNAAPQMELAAHVGGEGGATALYLGGFADPAKGGDDFLVAAAQAVSAAPELRVTMAGPGELPESGRELIARRPGCEWRGWLTEPEKDAALGQADFFVLASVSEGLPMALLEAMASGLAIVATDVGGVPEVLESERDALLVPAGDPRALAQALVRLAADPGLRARLGASARERADELGADRVAARLDAIYSGLLRG